MADKTGRFYVWGAEGDVAHQLVATPFTTREKTERAADALTRMEPRFRYFVTTKGRTLEAAGYAMAPYLR
jgi:hypothetical protein